MASQQISPGRSLAPPLERRALALWPRLDRAALRRCRAGPCPDRGAHLAPDLAARPTAIKQVLLMPSVSDDDVSTWFG